MAIDKVDFAMMARAAADVGSIAQALKFQIRSGREWDGLSPAAKESLDQIATLIARIVSGDNSNWDAIASYAQAVHPPTPPTLEIEREMRRLVREIPKANSEA